MKILLQNSQNKLFFRYSGVWTSSPERAFGFQTPQEVFQLIEREELQDVQLVVSLDNGKQFEAVSLQLSAPAGLSLHHD
jgi:hypothetical protein